MRPAPAAAAWLSLKIALLTATASVAIGTWAGFVLARMGRFRGFTLYAAMTNAPLVIPEVIQGISLLLLFVAMQQAFGWPAGRGWLTTWIGHVMLCLPLVVFSRVRMGLNPEMNALATVFIAAVTIGVVVVNRAMLARERRQARDTRMWHAAPAPGVSGPPAAPAAMPPVRPPAAPPPHDRIPHPTK